MESAQFAEEFIFGSVVGEDEVIAVVRNVLGAGDSGWAVGELEIECCYERANSSGGGGDNDVAAAEFHVHDGAVALGEVCEGDMRCRADEWECAE